MSYDGLPTTYQPSRVRVLVGVGAVVVVAGAIWSFFDRLLDLDVEPVEITIVSQTELELSVSCAADVTADVAETDEAVRIDDVDGTPIYGDCLGAITIRLANPLGDRPVFVEGEEWRCNERRCRPP